jgi:hypothetical protein
MRDKGPDIKGTACRIYRGRYATRDWNRIDRIESDKYRIFHFGFSILAFILLETKTCICLAKILTDRLSLNSTWAGSLLYLLLHNSAQAIEVTMLFRIGTMVVFYRWS